MNVLAEKAAIDTQAAPLKQTLLNFCSGQIETEAGFPILLLCFGYVTHHTSPLECPNQELNTLRK